LEATKRYSVENVDWRTYNKIMLDPIVYFVGKRDEGEGISQEEKQRILDYFFSKLHKAIEESPFVEHATQPGPSTLRLQAAVVDLGESHVTMGAISTYIPQVNLITLIATIAKDKPAFVGEMGVEWFKKRKEKGDNQKGGDQNGYRPFLTSTSGGLFINKIRFLKNP
jgi:hypothetical protein